MIEKISNINLGIFKNFKWTETLGKFNNINIIYGRNYSGKTTLSRIIRALETKEISNKYEKPQFEIKFTDATIVNQDNFTASNIHIKVFNEDFIRENLSFPYNDDGNINSFTILGKENNEIQQKINELKKELGSNEDGKETGLYREKIEKEKINKDKKNIIESAENILNSQLKNKATADRNISIKDNKKYGNPRYNIVSLQQDIKDVLSASYSKIGSIEKEKFKNLLDETYKDKISCFQIELDFINIEKSIKSLVEQKIVKTAKITELINNDLIMWAKQGKQLHKQGDKCAFCGNRISNDRWESLSNYFNDTVKNLEKNIEEQMQYIEDKKTEIFEQLKIDKEDFYSTFHERLEQLNLDDLKEKIKLFLENLKIQLEKKKNAIFDQINYESKENPTEDFAKFVKTYNLIIDENNKYIAELSKNQNDAKNQLRLQDIYDFLITIKYKEECKKIEILKKEKDKAEDEFNKTVENIKKREDSIKSLEERMCDEGLAKDKINEYLVHFFNSDYIKLEVQKEQTREENTTSNKQTKFYILRDNKPAYNLSEGECDIIAFCYFMAKLDLDHIRDGNKPIIWIDDPICSLDNNHIFSLYSIIQEELKQKNKYKQLFISTHSLDFLKHLKRLDYKNDKGAYFIISRYGGKSLIEQMPMYMKIYATEFNYLFKQIYDCAKTKSSIPTDENINIFYNFGNNARKFLDIYLFYKYPDMFGTGADEQALRERRLMFFGEEISAIYTNKFTNSSSHGSIERGDKPFEEPEITKVANLIIDKIKEKDEEQYNALLSSIGVNNDAKQTTEN